MIAKVVRNVLEDNSNNDVLISSDIHYNYTPNGTKVLLYYNSTWADHGMTTAEAREAQNKLVDRFEDAIVVSDMNPAYNCHSYTWYSQSTGNKYWMTGTYASYYMSDGSFSRVSNPKKNDKIWYVNDDHSAIYYNSTYYISKWGAAGVFKHDRYDSPYNASIVYFYR